MSRLVFISASAGISQQFIELCFSQYVLWFPPLADLTGRAWTPCSSKGLRPLTYLRSADPKQSVALYSFFGLQCLHIHLKCCSDCCQNPSRPERKKKKILQLLLRLFYYPVWCQHTWRSYNSVSWWRCPSSAACSWIPLVSNYTRFVNKLVITSVFIVPEHVAEVTRQRRYGGLLLPNKWSAAWLQHREGLFMQFI